MSSSSNKKSIIFYNGFREKSSCGYCKKDNSSYNNGMWASCLTVQAYQDMIDRGWRRSGKFCYKPSMDKTCCPLYTIRCEALNFQLSKSQKKIIKKVTSFLKNGESNEYPIDVEQVEREHFMKYDSHGVIDHDSTMQVNNTDNSIEEQNTVHYDSQNRNVFLTNKEDNIMDAAVNLNCNPETETISKNVKQVKPGEGANPNLPKCKKKKLLRIEKKLAKNPNFVIKTLDTEQKSLEDFIAENDLVNTEEMKKLRIKLLKLSPSSNSFEAEYTVYKAYQTIIHCDSDDHCTREQFIRFLVDSPLRIGTEEFAQTFDDGANLFAKYQIAVHNDQPDDCDMEQYLQFLVQSPLQAEKADHPDHPGYGSFHQQYWLGNKLIAVGVIDILPKCVSSVYLFYDPDYHNMVLGTYSTLREICLVRQLYRMSPDLKYYYMGFYIHSCPKMRYKAKFRPSYLLCPLRYTWHAIDKCIQKLDNVKYSIFDESKDIQDMNTMSIEDIPVLYSGTLMTYSMYKRMSKRENQDEQITEYMMLIGPKLAKQLIYCLLD